MIAKHNTMKQHKLSENFQKGIWLILDFMVFEHTKEAHAGDWVVWKSTQLGH